MKKDNKVKWLIAGAGDIVKSRAGAAIAETENSEITAIFAPSVGKAEALAERFSIPQVFHDYGEALAKSGADAVYIATPHHVHVEMALEAIASGKHFLCEKPLGINSGECRKLVEEVRKHPELVTSCSNYRLFSSQFNETKRLIDSGELGYLVGGWAHDEEPYYNPSNAPLLKQYGKSPILGFGFYLINIVQALFGVPDSVFASFSSFNCAKKDPYDIDDLENIIFNFKDGRQFTLFLNFATQGPLRHSYEFCCSQGRILWPGSPPHFNLPIKKIFGWRECDVAESVTPLRDGEERPNWHRPMFQDFVDAVLSGGKARCSVESAYMTSVITEAIFKSVEKGAPVNVL